MSGPYRVACDDCGFETEIRRVEAAPLATEGHSGRRDRPSRLAELGTGAGVTVGKGAAVTTASTTG